MDTDRELLESAAKAAGHSPEWREWRTGRVAEFGSIKYTNHEGFWLDGKQWNPLTDDGDALRLMVKLNADVTQHSDDLPTCVAVTIIRPDSAAPADYAHIVELHGNCPYAATRRAIVRAAAEIGRNMK